MQLLISESVIPGEIFKIKVLGEQIVFICSAALLEEVCDEKRFRKCVTGPVVEIRQAVHDALFSAYDNEPMWGIAHRIMAPFLSASVIEKQVLQMHEETSQLIEKWSQRDPSEQFNITDDLRRLNTQTTVSCFLGQRFHFLDGVEPPILGAMERIMEECLKRPTRPKLLSYILYQRGFDADIKILRDFAAKIITTRKSQPLDTEDMLHSLLNAMDPETGESLNDEQVKDEILTLLIGASTIANFLSFGIYYLLQNPQYIIKAREEIESVLQNDGHIDHAHLEKLPYCEAILRETLRLSTPAPGFNIEPVPQKTRTGPVLLSGGKYEIPSNQMMIIVLPAVNRDPEVFNNPEAFRPERMLGEAYEMLPSGVKKGFGNGKRECVGKLYAWQSSLVTLVTILREIDLTKADPNYQLISNGALNVMPHGFFVKSCARKR
jgi:cytochrome P450